MIWIWSPGLLVGWQVTTPPSLQTCAKEEPSRMSRHSMKGACKVPGSDTSIEVALMPSQIRMPAGRKNAGHSDLEVPPLA